MFTSAITSTSNLFATLNPNPINQNQMIIDNLDSNLSSSNIFEKIIHAGLDPISSAQNNLTTQINHLSASTSGGIIEPEALTSIQQESNNLVVEVTVAAKVIGQSQKALTELTHLQ
jgi:hypothetical protein